ncbi:uncharacterized protein PV07_06948 [Cladophialophora immunda]|uniref:SMP domain-containing protein n=1 Tax=Cladophialophora immunda TaxID=569365 RepID=A0A0D1ZGX0_9EURO|nr:uncharacterized protein PV07_06948 [Cladophialophora immunda]KIW27186.1 hypothetical protein PV07_06948 [Cladophialophora immunda]OQV02076.1 hypothetical protein CLAIMM_07327 [Cladophialophora immunda]
MTSGVVRGKLTFLHPRPPCSLNNTFALDFLPFSNRHNSPSYPPSPPPPTMESKQEAPTTALPTTSSSGMGASHRRSSSGISDDAAKSAHDFMAGTIRRSSSGVTDDAARAARDFVRSSSASNKAPGLSDDLTQKMHNFMEGPATHRESHSKYLPDVTLPGITDEVVEEAVEFVDAVEKTAPKA